MTKYFNPPLSFMLLSDQNNIYENISPFDRVLQTIKQSQLQHGESQLQHGENEPNSFLEQPVIDSSIIKRLKEEYGRNSNIASQLNDSKAIGFGYNIKDYSKNKKSNGNEMPTSSIAPIVLGVLALVAILGAIPLYLLLRRTKRLEAQLQYGGTNDRWQHKKAYDGIHFYSIY